MKKSTIRQRALFSFAPAIVLATIVVSPAGAANVTFAQYFQENGAMQEWNISTTGNSTTVTSNGSVFFLFSGVAGLPFSGVQIANFTLTATSTQIGSCGVACGPGDSFDQFGYTGTFSFTDESSVPGALLLAGTFSVTGSPSTTGAQFNSNIGSASGGFDASATAGNLNQLVLTSQFLNFTGQTQENAAFSLSSVVPDFSVGTVTGNQAYPSPGPFDASGTGTFASNPGPTASVAPEPDACFMIGGGLLGLGILSRKKFRKA